MTAFNELFDIETPAPAREVVAQAVARLNPNILHVPAAGGFRAIETIIRSGYPASRIYASDLGLFSSIIGYLSDHDRSLSELNIRFSEVGKSFLLSYLSDYDVAAGAMLAVKYEGMDPKHQYAVNLRRELWHHRADYFERLRDELKVVVEAINGIHYTISDPLTHLGEGRLPGDQAFYLFPPTRSPQAYVRMLHSELVSWNRQLPDEAWDKDSLGRVYATFTDAPMAALIYSAGDEGIPPSWDRLLVVSKKDRDDYVVCNRPLPLAHAVTEHTQTAGGKPRIFEVYNDQPITPDSVLEFVEIDRPTCMYYRDLFVHRLGTTQSEWYVAMLIDERLVTVIGLNRQRYMHWKSGYVKETFGISVTSQRYKRIGRLFMLALTTTAFRDWMRKHGRYGIREMLGIETTSLTKHEVSKNDRAMMKLVSREQLPNGTWKLQYRADLRDESFNEVLVRWLDTEARHTRQSGTPVADVGRGEKLSRADRKRIRRAAQQEVPAP